MTPAPQAHHELDSLIWEITVDCNDEDEVLMGFEGAFDEEANFPCPGAVVGEPVEVLSVSTGDARRGLIGFYEAGGTCATDSPTDGGTQREAARPCRYCTCSG